ncbi:DUF5677 domain-containing protein [Aquibium sp. ELW1220]|uniref:DUF5677 domain-containing protein n=1 Tax=Aquibium sp. ELW1220 TaxID=2976766 RepID=UPI0025B183D5|nr:DUF5677 domain-containing protein [Aquibium sp. ELW1220]MDN2580859.1 DUF5677 domain-containing protein [Aquibium sp. ELW1220]
MSDDDIPRLSCTEAEFVNAFRANGFLSPYVEEAIPAYTRQHMAWFDHAEGLNGAGLEAFNRRENEIVGLSSHHPTPIAMRMIYRTLSSFQAALILYRRAMIAEGDTLARNVYETAFWLGFIQKERDAAVRAFINDELKSQKDRATYYLEQFRRGFYERNPEIERQLANRVSSLKSKITNSISVKSLAQRSGFYNYYDSYKNLSASSAHNSLNSLHRYLNRNSDGSYDGHVVGPDPDSLSESLPVLCIGLGIALAMFCTIVALEHDEPDLQALLIKTDTLQRSQGVGGL